MTANDTKTLHDKNEPRFKGLMSMMDIMGGEISCDKCGRWQRLGTFIVSDAKKIATDSGWVFKNDQDICRICAATSTAR